MKRKWHTIFCLVSLLGVFLLSGCAGQENAAAPYAGYGYDADGNGTSSETTTMGSLQKNNGTKSDRRTRISA